VPTYKGLRIINNNNTRVSISRQ